jgi:hypothetical protein
MQTKDSAPVFTGASFWYYSENLWHCWPPVQFDTVVNGRPTVYMGHHVKEEKDEGKLGNYLPHLLFKETKYCEEVTLLAQPTASWLPHRASRPGLIDRILVGPIDRQYKQKGGSSI